MVLVYRTPNNRLITLIGVIFTLLSLIFAFWHFIVIKKAPQENSGIYDEDVQFLKQEAQKEGKSLVIMAIIMAIATIGMLIILFFFIFHSWVRTLLAFLALSLVFDLREYFNIEQKN